MSLPCNLQVDEGGGGIESMTSQVESEVRCIKLKPFWQVCIVF